MRQPRLSEMVAEQLRRRILSLEFRDGSMLPRQEELLEEYGVSVPSLREAMRILETEGFVTMLRGSQGGAVVHMPQAPDAAYTFALVLESRSTGLGDVMSAMQWLEPVCAAACATRDDRHDRVLPRLRSILEESEALLDDPALYGARARDFHVELVAACANETMRLVVGALESLWVAQVGALRRERVAGVIPDRAVRELTLDEHRRILEAIERGDAGSAESAAREHFSHRTIRRVYVEEGAVVRAALLREGEIS